MRKTIFVLCLAMILPKIMTGCHQIDNLNPPTQHKINNAANRPEVITSDSQQQTNDLQFFLNRPQTKPASTSIKIYKGLRVLELYGDRVMIGRFKIALGGNPTGDKNQEGDSRTPEGQYYICTRNDRSRFTLFLGLSYPNIEDAQRGLENQLINSATFDNIKRAIEQKQQPPWNTPLGGAVGIHGKGNEYDWTLGCIALSDEDIKILWEYVPLITPVEILK